MGNIHIALGAEQLFTVFGIPVTNTLITSVLVAFGLALFAYYVGRHALFVPGKVQTAVEALFGLVLDYIEETLESRSLARRYFPLLMTIFLFVFVANMVEFAPGIGSIGFFEGIDGEKFSPLLRSVNTDFNMTLALALISFFVIEMSGVAVLGFLKYAGKFVNFKSVLGFMVGIMELFSEIARLISFSFRLFGNIFAGEVLVVVATAFVPFFLPVPLMLFEVFVGFIQAAIFALLTLFFIKIAITEPH